jgi:hypothetical protein
MPVLIACKGNAHASRPPPTFDANIVAQIKSHPQSLSAMVTLVLVILVLLPVALLGAMVGFLVLIEHTFLATGTVLPFSIILVLIQSKISVGITVIASVACLYLSETSPICTFPF